MVVVYVMVILWLVSANFRSAAASAAAADADALPGNGGRYSSSRGLLGAVLGGVVGVRTSTHAMLDPDDAIEAEALLVMQDEKGKKKPRCTTHFEDEYEGDPV